MSLIIHQRRYKMIPHARQRLKERFGLDEIPQGKVRYVKRTSNNRKVYRIGDVYFVIKKEQQRVVTVLTEKEVHGQGR